MRASSRCIASRACRVWLQHSDTPRPHCSRTFEYRPAQSGHTLHCPNDKQSGIRKACGKAFCIAVFSASAAKLAEEKDRARAEVEARQRRAAASEARASRGSLASRYGDDDDDDDEMAELGAFIVSEDCPRCGKQFTTGHAAHLRVCRGGQQRQHQGRQASGQGARRQASVTAGRRIVGSYDEEDKLYREPKAQDGGQRSPAAKSTGRAPPRKRRPSQQLLRRQPLRESQGKEEARRLDRRTSRRLTRTAAGKRLSIEPDATRMTVEGSATPIDVHLACGHLAFRHLC